MNLGIKYILIAGVFFSIINALVKYYSHIPAIQIVFFRSIVTLVLSYIYIKKKNICIFSKHTPLLLLRGLSGATALILYFITIQNSPLATAVTILYLAPIFTVLIAIFLLKEKPLPMQWPFILLSLSGALVIKAYDFNIELKYFLMGITAAFFAGLAYNTIRLLKDKADPQLVIFYFPLVTLPICIPLMIESWVWPSFLDTFGLLFIGISTQIAQVYMTKAYMHSAASEISHYNYLTTVYALICGVIFFGEEVYISGIVGLTMIIVGVVLSTKFSKAKPTR